MLFDPYLSSVNLLLEIRPFFVRNARSLEPQWLQRTKMVFQWDIKG